MGEVRTRSIILADLDSFFVAVELALQPRFAAGPCAVAAGGRSVVLSASYAARAFGVRAGMPLRSARTLCPDLLVLPPRMAAYRRVSRDLFARAATAGGVVEQVSVDEAFWDVSSVSSERWDSASDRPGVGPARWLRALALGQFGLPMSVGVASSKTVAKVACEVGKPDGLTVVPVGGDAKFLAHLPVSSVPGVGPVAAERLADAGAESVQDALALPRPVLVRALGARFASRFTAAASGLDSDPVRPPSRPKSISAESTSSYDARSPVACDELFSSVLSVALRRLRSAGLAARTVSVVHRSPAGSDRSAAQTLQEFTDDEGLLSVVAWGLHSKLSSPQLRLAGVSFSGLSRDVQLAFDDDSGAVVAPSPSPSLPPVHTLSEVAYRGFRFEHESLGPAVVHSLEAAGFQVGFEDKVRLLDPMTVVPPQVEDAPLLDGAND